MASILLSQSDEIFSICDMNLHKIAVLKIFRIEAVFSGDNCSENAASSAFLPRRLPGATQQHKQAGQWMNSLKMAQQCLSGIGQPGTPGQLRTQNFSGLTRRGNFKTRLRHEI